MNRPGEQLLAGAGLSPQQHGRVTSGNGPGHRQCPFHHVAFMNDPMKGRRQLSGHRLDQFTDFADILEYGNSSDNTSRLVKNRSSTGQIMTLGLLQHNLAVVIG